MKMIFNYLSFLFVATSLVFSVSACNQKDVSTQAEAKKKPSYPRTVKPHAAVFMEYQRPQNVDVNQAIPVDITISSGRAVDNIKVSLRAGDGLHTADVLVYSLGAQTAGQKNTLQITVQASEEGRYRLYLNAALVTGDATQSRSFIIPVNIGKQLAAPKLKTTGVVIEKTTGEKIISMPATEIP